MKAEYFKNEEFNTENLMEPWKENFSREEVKNLLLEFAPYVKYYAPLGKWEHIVDNWIKENL